eukprot:145746_1
MSAYEIYEDHNIVEFPDINVCSLHASKPVLQPIKSGVELAMEKIKSVSSVGERGSCRGSKRNSLRLHKRASSIKLEDGISSYLHNMDGTIWSEIKLPSGLPKSELINEKQTLVEQLYELYLKYIKSGCEQEINIAYFQRKHITDILEHEIKKKNNDGHGGYGRQLEEQMFGLMDHA